MTVSSESSAGAVTAAVIDYLASANSLTGQSDVLEIAPGMTYAQAYAAQFASKVRQAGANGPIIGYQASLTSEAAKRFGPPDMPKPYVGTLQLRNWHEASVPFPSNADYAIECETGLRMAVRLQGPNLTAAQARRAVAYVHAAMEIVPWRSELLGRSGQHMVAIHNFGSAFVFGEQRNSPELEIVQEPIELLVDGKSAVRAVVGNSGGDPFAVLAEIANTIAPFGLALEPGMVIMTGSATAPHRLERGAKRVEARFGKLGAVSVCFDA
jgi:2-keto-4-pentenoate hydratase